MTHQGDPSLAIKDRTQSPQASTSQTTLIGSAPAEVVPARLDPELRAAVEARATADQTTTSDVISEALRHRLDVA